MSMCMRVRMCALDKANSRAQPLDRTDSTCTRTRHGGASARLQVSTAVRTKRYVTCDLEAIFLSLLRQVAFFRADAPARVVGRPTSIRWAFAGWLGIPRCNPKFACSAKGVSNRVRRGGGRHANKRFDINWRDRERACACAGKNTTLLAEHSWCCTTYYPHRESLSKAYKY